MEKNETENKPRDIDFTLWRVLDHTQFMVSRLREKELADYGLTQEQTHVLDILSQSGGSTTINNIVGITQRQHHSISTLIDRMCKQGLVTKRKSTNDNRKYNVIITKRGQALYAKLTRESIKNVFSILSEKDKIELEVHLKPLLNRAYELLGKEYTPFFPEG